jgi:hypothetical protein
MKKRLQKKLHKKIADSQRASGPKNELPESAKLLAVECWRIRKLLPEFKDNKKYLVLNSSIEKMTEVLATAGIEIEDPEETDFRDGMTLEVALFEETPGLAAGKRVISETLAPAVYVKDRLVQAAKVIVSVGTGDK